MPATLAETSDLLGDAISELLQSNPKPYFVQVGGFDGVSFDPLRQQIVEKNLSGLIVEPHSAIFREAASALCWVHHRQADQLRDYRKERGANNPAI